MYLNQSANNVANSLVFSVTRLKSKQSEYNDGYTLPIGSNNHITLLVILYSVYIKPAHITYTHMQMFKDKLLQKVHRSNYAEGYYVLLV